MGRAAVVRSLAAAAALLALGCAAPTGVSAHDAGASELAAATAQADLLGQTIDQLRSARIDSLLASAPPARPGGRCADTVDVPGQGPSCRLADRLWAVPGRDGSTFATHGPDFLDAATPMITGDTEVLLAAAGDVTAEPHDSRYVACTDAGHPDGYAVAYVRRTALADDSATVVPQVRAALRQASEFVHQQSVDDGVDDHVAPRLRFACTPDGQIDVHVLAVAAGRTENADHLRTLVRSNGIGSVAGTSRRALVYFGGQNSAGALGQGTVYPDAKPTADNANNGSDAFAAHYAMDGGPRWYVFLHELMHTMGAVQAGSPDSNGQGHCTSDADVLCYDEHTRTHLRCAQTELDCGNDTYFDAGEPTRGSWLATHWNAGGRQNRWIGWGDPPIVATPPPASTVGAVTSGVAVTTPQDTADPVGTPATPPPDAAASGDLPSGGSGDGAAGADDGGGGGDDGEIGGDHSADGAAADVVPGTGPELRVAMAVRGRDTVRIAWTSSGTVPGSATWRVRVRVPAQHRSSTVELVSATHLVDVPAAPPGTTLLARVELRDGGDVSVSSPEIGFVRPVAGARCTWRASDAAAPAAPVLLRLAATATNAVARVRRSTDTNGVCALWRLRRTGKVWAVSGPPVAGGASLVRAPRERGHATQYAFEAVDAAGHRSRRLLVTAPALG